MAVHAGLQRRLTVLRKGVGRHGQNGDMGQLGVRQGADAPRGLIAVHPGHLHVHKDQVVVTRGGPADLFHGCVAIVRLLHQKTGIAEDLAGDLTVQGVVLHQQDAAARSVEPLPALRQLRRRIGGSAGAEGVGADELGALARLAAAGDGTAQLLHQTLGDGEAQTGPLNAGDDAVVLPLEGVEDAAAELLAHADAVVLYGKAVVRAAAAAAGLADSVGDVAAGGSVLDGVADEVQLDLVHLQGVKVRHGVLYVAGDIQRQLLFLQVRLKHVLHIFQHGGDVVGPDVQRHLAAFDVGQIQHAVDKAQQILAGEVDLLQAVRHAGGVVDVFFRQRGEAHDGVHGGADIVGHIKEKGALGAVGAFGGLLGLPELRSAAHIVIDAAGHGDGVHIAGDVFHQDIPGLHPMNLTIIAGLAHLHMEQALAPPVGVQLGIAVHEGMQLFEILGIGHGGLQGVHHLLHGEALEQALVDDAVVIDGESLVFRQVLLQNEGVHGAGVP